MLSRESLVVPSFKFPSIRSSRIGMLNGGVLRKSSGPFVKSHTKQVKQTATGSCNIKSHSLPWFAFEIHFVSGNVHPMKPIGGFCSYLPQYELEFANLKIIVLQRKTDFANSVLTIMICALGSLIHWMLVLLNVSESENGLCFLPRSSFLKTD